MVDSKPEPKIVSLEEIKKKLEQQKKRLAWEKANKRLLEAVKKLDW